MYEFDLMILALIVGVIVFLFGLYANSEGIVILGCFIMFGGIGLWAVYYNVPDNTVAATLFCESMHNPGGHFKIPFEPVYYCSNDEKYSTAIYAYASDGVQIEYRVNFNYKFVKPDAFPQFITKYGQNYMDATYRKYMQDYFGTIATMGDSRYWFHCNTLTTIDPKLESMLNEAFTKNGMEMTSNGVEVNIYMDEKIYNQYGMEDTKARSSGLIEQAESARRSTFIS